MTKKELQDLLNQYDIPVENWGMGEAKTMEHLLGEVNERECVLTKTKDGLVREICAIAIDIFFDDLHLKEDRQEFADGRIRRRPLLERSLYEKLAPEERGTDLKQAVKRALREELGVVNHVLIAYLCEETDKHESQSYPGLMSIYRFLTFRVDLPESEFRTEGYVEIQKDKKTFFVWTSSK